MPKKGYQSSWQYYMEDTPENPTSAGIPFKLPGTITGDTPMEPRFNIKEFRGLKQPSSTDMRAVDSIEASKNEYAWSMTYIPMKAMAWNTYSVAYDFRHFHNLAMNASSSTTLNGARTYGTGVATELRTFSIFKEIDNLQHWFSGCKISKLTAKCSVDNPVEITVEGLASNATFANLAKTDATTLRDGVPFMWQDSTVYIDGVLATFCTAWEYSINNEAASDHVLGDRDPKGIILQGRTIDVAVTRQYNDTAQYANAKNNTAKSVTIVLDDGTDVNIGFRQCKYDGHPIPGDVDSTQALIHVLRLKAEAMFTN